MCIRGRQRERKQSSVCVRTCVIIFILISTSKNPIISLIHFYSNFVLLITVFYFEIAPATWRNRLEENLFYSALLFEYSFSRLCFFYALFVFFV